MFSFGSKFHGRFKKNKLFYIRVELINNVVVVSGGRQKDSAIHVHVSFLPQTPFPSRLPHNIKQSSLGYTVGPWLPEGGKGWEEGRFGEFEMDMYTAQLSSSAVSSPMDCSTPGLPVHHQLLELTQTHVLQVVGTYTLFYLKWITNKDLLRFFF